MSKRRKRAKTTIDVIRELKTGTTAPSEVTVAMRRACVQRLRMDGVTHEEIADLFGVHPKTIGPDAKAIRRSGALRKSPDLAGELFGELRLQVETAVARLRRLECDPAATPADRIAAKRAIVELFDLEFQILAGLFVLFRSQALAHGGDDLADLR